MVQALITFLAVYVGGAALLLERRCLGKPAVVQPLVLCLIAGLSLDDAMVGLWLGVSLQLLSMGQSHYCNWVLSSIGAAGAMVILNDYNVHLSPGDPAIMGVLVMSVLVGIVFDFMDRKLNLSRSASEQRGMNIWRSDHSGDEFSRLIYRRVLRGFLFAGVQSMLGVGLVFLAGYFLGTSDSIQAGPEVRKAVALVVPLFGVSVTLGSLSGRLFPFYALVGVAVSAAVMGIGGAF
jgi:hypothetical protein